MCVVQYLNKCYVNASPLSELNLKYQAYQRIENKGKERLQTLDCSENVKKGVWGFFVIVKQNNRLTETVQKVQTLKLYWT